MSNKLLVTILVSAAFGCGADNSETFDASTGGAFDASTGGAFDASTGGAFDASTGGAFDATKPGLDATASCPTQVYTGNINISSPAELANLSGYTSIVGSLSISSAEIIDLDDLSCLQEVSESLNISFCDKLSDIEGLQNLTSVGNNFGFYHVYEATNLDGLSNLVQVGGDLDISFNTKLPQCHVDALLARLVANGFDGVEAILLNEGEGSCD